MLLPATACGALSRHLLLNGHSRVHLEYLDRPQRGLSRTARTGDIHPDCVGGHSGEAVDILKLAVLYQIGSDAWIEVFVALRVSDRRDQVYPLAILRVLQVVIQRNAFGAGPPRMLGCAGLDVNLFDA